MIPDYGEGSNFFTAQHAEYWLSQARPLIRALADHFRIGKNPGEAVRQQGGLVAE